MTSRRTGLSDICSLDRFAQQAKMARDQLVLLVVDHITLLPHDTPVGHSFSEQSEMRSHPLSHSQTFSTPHSPCPLHIFGQTACTLLIPQNSKKTTKSALITAEPMFVAAGVVAAVRLRLFRDVRMSLGYGPQKRVRRCVVRIMFPSNSTGLFADKSTSSAGIPASFTPALDRMR